MKTVLRLGACVLFVALLCGVCAAAGVQIDKATVSGKSVHVTTSGASEGAKTILALYDKDGRMIAVRFASAMAETLSVKPTSVKAFATNDSFVPLGDAARADVVETNVIEVSTQAELIAANGNPDCDVIAVTASFDVTQNMVIDKDLRIQSGVTLTVYSQVQCNGTVTQIGSGKLVDVGGLFAVEFGIEVIDEIDENWG